MEARAASLKSMQAQASARRLSRVAIEEAEEATAAEGARVQAAATAEKEASEAAEAKKKLAVAQAKFDKEDGEARAAQIKANKAKLYSQLTQCCGGAFVCLAPMLGAA